MSKEAKRFRKANGAVDFNSGQRPVDYYADIQVDALMQAYADEEVKKERNEIVLKLDAIGKNLYKEVGTLSYVARCLIHDLKETLKQLDHE